jgi:hypothetical protein
MFLFGGIMKSLFVSFCLSSLLLTASYAENSTTKPEPSHQIVAERPEAGADKVCKPSNANELRRELLKALYEERKQVLRDEAALKEAEARKATATKSRSGCVVQTSTGVVLIALAIRYGRKHPGYEGMLPSWYLGSAGGYNALMGGNGIVSSNTNIAKERKQIEQLKADIKTRLDLIDLQLERAQQMGQ